LVPELKEKIKDIIIFTVFALPLPAYSSSSSPPPFALSTDNASVFNVNNTFTPVLGLLSSLLPSLLPHSLFILTGLQDLLLENTF
jgi:hypothetical protein